MPPLNRGHGRPAPQTLRSTALGLALFFREVCQIFRKFPRSDKNKNTSFLNEILATCQILKSTFPRFKRSSAPQQLCTPLRSSNAQRGMEMENSIPPLCDWLHILIHASRKQSQLLLNCWSPPPYPCFCFYIVLVSLLQLCVYVCVCVYLLNCT